jgi:hypothetical protein
MDYNWFFSSLAQSAAAIVGILGGFTITKILSNQAVFSQNKKQLKELKIQVDTIHKELDYAYSHKMSDAISEDKFKQLITEKERQIKMNSHFIDSIRDNPESSFQITLTLILLIVLFFLGVIYPLSFMPFPSTDYKVPVDTVCYLYFAKNILLIGVSLIFSIIIGMFAWTNFKMKYSLDDIKNLDDLHDKLHKNFNLPKD